MQFLVDTDTERIQFRKVARDDFDQWLRFFQDPQSFTHWTVERKDPAVECEEWYLKQLNRYAMDLGGMNALIEKSSGKLVGHAGLLVQEVDGQRELELAYSLVPGFRGKGFAKEASRACRNYAFENSFATSLISIISLTNVTSSHVAVHNGMRIDKQTVYKGNPVNIFRVGIEDRL